MRLSLFVAALLFATAAASPPDPVLDRIIADAKAAAPATMAFERTTKTTSQDEGAAAETKVRTDRWDGRQLALISTNGKPASPAEIAEYRKATTGRPIPGYHRLADFLKAGAARIPDAQGRTVYRITGLPKGSINVGKDISGDLVADAIVDASGAQPYISRLRVFLPKPLSFFMVAKLDAFEVVNEYRLGPAGRPALARSTQTLTGAQFGKAGTTRTEIAYTILR
jgi:hypothetical protein